MARDLEDIQQQMLEYKDTQEALKGLNSVSKVSLYRLYIYIVSYAIWVFEAILDKHTQDVNTLLANLHPHTVRWYQQKALAFEFGFDLLPDSDQFNNQGFDDQQIEQSKIIQYASVVETDKRVVLKIATRQNGKLTPISEQQYTSFSWYMNQIKDAGVSITVVNYQPDILRLDLTIIYDPLVLDSSGMNLIQGNYPVQEALDNFLKNMPFNGELVLDYLSCALNQVQGVTIAHINSAYSAWLNPETNGYGEFVKIDIKKIPEAGYFQMEDYNRIKYVVSG